MEAQKIEIAYTDPAASLTAYPPAGGDGAAPAVLILPGGGYQVCARAEGAPIAERFASMGYAAFVLEYSVRSRGTHTVFPEPLREVAQTVRCLRENAAALGLDPARLALLGASAGGHLAAYYANAWDTPEVYEGFIPDGAEPDALRPDACVLLYCAAVPGEGMLSAMLGHGAPFSAEELDAAAVRDYVGPQTPPTVLFHSATDPDVPMENSVELFAALQRSGVPSELHVFGCGLHAAGLEAGTPGEDWPALADAFLRAALTEPERFDPEAVARAQAALFAGA